MLETLFDAKARRRARLDDLVAARVALQAEFAAAIDSDRDTDPIQGRMLKLDLEIQAVRDAINATEAAAERERQAEKDERINRLHRQAVEEVSTYVRIGAELEAIVVDVLLPKVRELFAAWRACREAERLSREAGSRMSTVTDKVGISANDTWRRIWLRFHAERHKAGEQLIGFPESRPSSPMGTVAEHLEREFERITTQG